ncbi:T9SS type A sorting domain-containing protein [Neotamlana laminarinivorans]|uniref:T9SS type A sorting domain-containing protein n=1 Tax=Neotamlana laminarinivorans TaxID=2883124 RepID=A0A9X1HWW3_9FLAO|nr:T9SS type A sorting domain-containing protein [Tamlana laminarinivorans]MCB4797380.1 T9SS type A sorting domain-containing protein [Tamlana laminarinivorans]
MKNILTFIVLVFTTVLSYSQDLYVADNSYLFSNGIHIFVNNDIRLETATSYLYLRGDAQLTQNNDIKNSDAGSLSLYQNQTTNVYEYNYFCSPVGLGSDGTVNINADFNGSNIYDPMDDTDTSNVNSSVYTYTTDFNGTATELSNYWIYTLRDAEGYHNWQQVFDTGNIEAGYGFTLKGSPNANNVLDFRGRPNNGTITVSCSFDGVDNQPSGTPNYAETLTGNPYPSAIDLKLFFVNSANNQAVLSPQLYFWEQKPKFSHYLQDYEGGYATYIPGDPADLSDNGTYTIAPFINYNNDGSDGSTTGGSTTDYSTNNSRRYAAVGQGFIIASNVNGGYAEFTNDMRLAFNEDSNPTGSGAVFAKNKDAKSTNTINYPISHNGVNYKSIFENPTIIPEIRIHTRLNNTYYKENVIAFRNTTPNNHTYNKFFDALNINSLNTDAYLISENEHLSIKSIIYDVNTTIPLGLKTDKNNTEFNITINKLNNTPNNLEVFLLDKESGIFTDIINNTFNITLDSGEYHNRFEITFTNKSLNTEDEATFTNLNIYQNNTTAELNLTNPSLLNIKRLTVFDISGKQVLNHNILKAEPEYSFSTKNISDGIYIVKIRLDNQQTLSKKIAIKHKK